MGVGWPDFREGQVEKYGQNWKNAQFAPDWARIEMNAQFAPDLARIEVN